MDGKPERVSIGSHANQSEAALENTLIRIDSDAQRQRTVGCSDLLEGQTDLTLAAP